MQHVIAAFIGKVSNPYHMMAMTRLSNSEIGRHADCLLAMAWSLLNAVHARPRCHLRSSATEVEVEPK